MILSELIESLALTFGFKSICDSSEAHSLLSLVEQDSNKLDVRKALACIDEKNPNLGANTIFILERYHNVVPELVDYIGLKIAQMQEPVEHSKSHKRTATKFVLDMANGLTDGYFSTYGFLSLLNNNEALFSKYSHLSLDIQKALIDNLAEAILSSDVDEILGGNVEFIDIVYESLPAYEAWNGRMKNLHSVCPEVMKGGNRNKISRLIDFLVDNRERSEAVLNGLGKGVFDDVVYAIESSKGLFAQYAEILKEKNAENDFDKVALLKNPNGFIESMEIAKPYFLEKWKDWDDESYKEAIWHIGRWGKANPELVNQYCNLFDKYQGKVDSRVTDFVGRHPGLIDEYCDFFDKYKERVGPKFTDYIANVVNKLCANYNGAERIVDTFRQEDVIKIMEDPYVEKLDEYRGELTTVLQAIVYVGYDAPERLPDLCQGIQGVFDKRQSDLDNGKRPPEIRLNEFSSYTRGCHKSERRDVRYTHREIIAEECR